jgi:putative toxin-antitoxin system antitoxin component (TIGR02293 family)
VTVVADLLAGDIVDAADIARVIGISTRSVARWQAGEVAAETSSERLLELKAVLDLARRVLGDGSARQWLHAPVPDLHYEKPLDLIAAGQSWRVVDVLLAFAEGVTA